MKVFLSCIFALLSLCAAQVPTLNTIMEHSFTSIYGCAGSMNYSTSGLFLSPYAQKMNTPGMLFYGNCNPSFEVASGGASFDVITDFGDGVTLEEVSAQYALTQNNSASFFPSYFYRSLPSVINHTYAVVLNRGTERALWTFTVTALDTSAHTCTISYAVLYYALINEVEYLTELLSFFFLYLFVFLSILDLPQILIGKLQITRD